MSNLRRRIVAGLGANAFAQGVGIVIQLASLPLFLHQWDAATYGTWLMLSALPAYLSMADVGMVTAAGNRMTMAMGQGDRAQATQLFHSATAFIGVVGVVLALIAFALAAWLPLPKAVDADARLALAALAACMLVTIVGGLVDALFKATGRYPVGTMLASLVRLAEWGGSMLGLLSIGSFSGVAIGGLMARVAGTVVAAAIARSGSHGITWGIKSARRDTVRELIRPAASFMVFPMSNALNFQGMTLLVGAAFGPVTVALFNTYRTIARVAVQATSIYSLALWAEFSRMFGNGGSDAVRRVYRKSTLIGFGSAVGFSVLLFALAPWLLDVWSHGEIAYVPLTMLLMLTYAALDSAWHVPRVLLLSVNHHHQLAILSLVTAALVLVVATPVSRLHNLDAVVVVMLAGEAVMAGSCLLLVRRLLRATTFDAQNAP